MAQRYYSATAKSMSLVSGVNESVSSITVDTVAGLPVQTPFTLVLDVDQAAEEVVTVTAVSGSILTVERAQDGTTAQTHYAGAVVRHMATARDYREPQQHIAATTGVHGLATGSALVGTTDTQTLTGKSLSGAANTFTNIPQSAVTNLTTALSTLTTADSNEATAREGVATDLSNHANAAAAHGATGAVVGTTNAQTLTNKTLTSPVINTPTIASPTVTTPPANIANPTGVVVEFAGATAPTGWYICDGSLKDRTTDAALFAVIGTTYGVGDGATTFALPNLKGKIPVGLDASQAEFNALAKTGGEKAHQLTKDELAKHRHRVGGSGENSSATYSYFDIRGGGGIALANVGSSGTSLVTGPYIEEAGGDVAHNNLQPFVVMNYIIKA